MSGPADLGALCEVAGPLTRVKPSSNEDVIRSAIVAAVLTYISVRLRTQSYGSRRVFTRQARA